MSHANSTPLGPESDSEKVRAAVAQFGEEVLPRMRGDGRTEDRIREPVYNLMRALSKVFGRGIVVHDEVPLTDISARPDFAVDAKAGRLGFIELKSQKVGIPERWGRPTKHDRDQWTKFSGLPNIIYTDGLNWGLYRNGQKWGSLASLKGDLSSSGPRLMPLDETFETVIREFLIWHPEPPLTLRGVVLDVAPLCRLLRFQVAEQMSYERTSSGKRVFTTLANEWRQTLFPSLSDDGFADAYAQTVTFALLLARVDGITFDDRSPGEIAEQLSKQHCLMGEALAILANSRWVEKLSVVDTLRRIVGNIDLDQIGVSEPGNYALLYETFLSEYDPKLRRKSGTYYTPDSVARAMVGFTDQILKERFDKKRGFAANDVYIIDPAMGAGTFLVEIIDSVAETLRKEHGTTEVSGSHISELFADRLIGFEIQAAPFAVAEMRLHHTLKSKYKTELPRKEVRFLSNALDDPDSLPLPLGQLYDVLKSNYEGANQIKRFQDVMVVIGNPPWRQGAKGAAPWIEEPRNSAVITPEFPTRPSLDEFRLRSQGKRAFNLSNMWTFFWRWAVWKVFESSPTHPAGIAVLITPQAYMTSDSYAGMRKHVRDICDEGWIIDLSPEGFQPPTSTRIFPTVQQPICVGVFARYQMPDRAQSAKIHYTSISGSQSDKMKRLSALKLDGPEWEECPSQPVAPFLALDPVWLDYPRLGDLMPWGQPGVTPNRNWVYAPSVDVLRCRWLKLLNADDRDKAALFKETDGHKVTREYPPLPGIDLPSVPLIDQQTSSPLIVRTGFRSFDRQYLIYDSRVIDRPRRALWDVFSDEQIYVCEPPAYRFNTGPGLTFSELVPNVDFFMGHHGGKVYPLYRDSTTKEPNVAPGLLSVLSSILGFAVTEKDLVAYVAAVASHSRFTEHFVEELRAPGVRVPLTRNPELWIEALEVGSELIWLHTYGYRFVDVGACRPREAPRLPEKKRPRPNPPLPSTSDSRRDLIQYDQATQSIIVGDSALPGGPGRIVGVTAAVWKYVVGDMAVVSSWFDYRRGTPMHKKYTSELDTLNQNRWTSEFEDGIFDLLNVVGRCVALEDRQAALLDRVCSGSLLTVADLVNYGVFPIPPIFYDPPHPLLGDTLDSESDD